ncbi:PaaX family transcriptional regulator C-terminal domain-containing protein [Paracoccus aerius]
MAEGPALSPEDALIARLLLVHLYRGVLLRDPGLPAEALPADWPGHAAQALFSDLYPALSPGGGAYRAGDGRRGRPPAGKHPRTQARLHALA